MPSSFHKQILIAIVVALLAGLSSVAVAQGEDDPLNHPFGMSIGAGYLHAGEEITNIWGNGFALEMSLGYKPWRSFGFTVGGVYGSTSISDWMKNKVRTYAPSTDEYGTSESTGGNFYQLLLGPTFALQLFNSDVVLSVGGGGVYYGSEEAGMGNIEDYTPRWTFGWGYYFETGLTRHVASDWAPLTYGITLRYSAMRSRVNDFFYDRVYGTNSYDAIPYVYLWDRRLQISVSLGIEM